MKHSKLDSLLHNFKLKGKATGVFPMISLLANTQLLIPDKSFWAYRADIMARDRDQVEPGWAWQRVN